MLSVNAYPQDYIDSCRHKIVQMVAAYENMMGLLSKQSRTNEVLTASVINAFDDNFFNNMVLVLDNLFVNRSRTIEGKDGNPAHEVRILSASIASNKGRLTPEKSAKYDPATSVLHLKPGDEIRLRLADFAALSGAYFAEIERKFKTK